MMTYDILFIYGLNIMLSQKLSIAVQIVNCRTRELAQVTWDKIMHIDMLNDDYNI
jgi:hypothetical protein